MTNTARIEHGFYPVTEADTDRWIHCGVCRLPLDITLTNGVALLKCPHCNRQFVVERGPMGGERDGLPEFVSEHYDNHVE